MVGDHLLSIDRRTALKVHSNSNRRDTQLGKMFMTNTKLSYQAPKVNSRLRLQFSTVTIGVKEQIECSQLKNLYPRISFRPRKRHSRKKTMMKEGKAW